MEAAEGLERMTVAQYYAVAVYDGRAVVQGEPWEPQRWIARVDDEYWHCQSDDGRVIGLDPSYDVRVLLRFKAIGGRPRKQRVQ